MSVHEVDCLLESMDSVQALLGEIDEMDWQVQSLCPAWRVRHVVTHLDGIEEALTGWRPAGEAPAPFDIVGKVFDEVDDWSPQRLLSRLRTVLGDRRTELLAADTNLFDEVSWTPVGVQTYGRFMAIRNFDFWLHEQDIRPRSDAPATQADPPPNWPSTRCAAASGTSSANAPPYPTDPACSSTSMDRSRHNSQPSSTAVPASWPTSNTQTPSSGPTPSPSSSSPAEGPNPSPAWRRATSSFEATRNSPAGSPATSDSRFEPHARAFWPDLPPGAAAHRQHGARPPAQGSLRRR